MPQLIQQHPVERLVELYLSGHEAATETLQKVLDSGNDLHASLEGLFAMHRITGFIVDDLSKDQAFRLSGEYDRPSFEAHFNPRRRDRFKGGPRTHPPPGIASSNGGCFLDPNNIAWMQNGTQMPYKKEINGRSYNLLYQPCPFGERHFTMAGTACESQGWRPDPIRLRNRVFDLCCLARLLPDHVALQNGVLAGASITNWFRNHVLLGRDLPIQRAARVMRREQPQSVDCMLRLDLPFWPMVAFRISGPPDRVADQVVEVAQRWNRIAEERASECIAVIAEDGGVAAYYIPRDRRYPFASGFGGAVGAYECAGVFVFSEEAEGLGLREQRIGFDYVWKILLGVRPREVDLLR